MHCTTFLSVFTALTHWPRMLALVLPTYTCTALLFFTAAARLQSSEGLSLFTPDV